MNIPAFKKTVRDMKSMWITITVTSIHLTISYRWPEFDNSGFMTTLTAVCCVWLPIKTFVDTYQRNSKGTR